MSLSYALPGLLQHGLALDLEVHPHTDQLLKIGLVDVYTGRHTAFLGRFDHKEASAHLQIMAGQASCIVGHNILGHDLAWLAAYWPDVRLQRLPAIDTLHLSPLAFPRNPYHHLVKDYKLVRSSINDPVADCRQSLVVLQDELDAFATLSKEQCLLYGAALSRTWPQSGFADLFTELTGRSIPDLPDLQSFWMQALHGKACTTAGRQIFSTLWRDAVKTSALAYILAWLDVAGGNSVLPGWVWKQQADIPAALRLLRETPCADPDCLYCASRPSARAQLQRYFGYDDFLPIHDENPPLQAQVVDSMLRGEDCLAILPTGAGKSLCYQLPALTRAEQRKTLTIIISPLQSLMKDQVDGLSRKGILQGCTVNSSLTQLERANALEGIRMGDRDLVWISPEQLRNTGIKKVLKSREIGLVVMDEAHCFSKWGHDFRPDYLALAGFLKDIIPPPPYPEPQIACFTATAKQDVRDEILLYFREEMGRDLQLFEGGHERTNLRFDVIACPEADKPERMDSILRELLPDKTPGGGIVFAPTRKQTQTYAEFLADRGWIVDYYHAGRTPEEKRSVQDRFLAGDLRVIVATNAFGMGVDKPDVRVVIHAATPGSLENYLQEAGRAGRDRNQALCCLLYDPDDLDTQFDLCRASELSMRDIRSMYGGLKSLTQSRKTDTLVMTSGELLAAEEFADYGFDTLEADAPLLDTKVKTALSWLERSGKILRGDNKSLVIQGNMLVKSMDDAGTRMAGLNLSASERELWQGLVSVLTQAGPRELLNTDSLSSQLGQDPDRILRALGAMREAGILDHDLNMTAYVRKSIADDSLARFTGWRTLEEALLKLMEEDEPDGGPHVRCHLPIRHVSQRLKDQGHQVTPVALQQILELWLDERLIRLGKHKEHTFAVTLRQPWTDMRHRITRRGEVAQVLLRFLLDRVAPGVKGKDLLVSFRSGQLVTALHRDVSTSHLDDKPVRINAALFALHAMRAICLQNGLAVIRPAMTIQVTDPKGRFGASDYLSLSLFYKEKITQVHIMGRYAELGTVFDGIGRALQFVHDYFRTGRQAFADLHLREQQATLELPVTTQTYNAILTDLSPIQRRIVEAPLDSNMLVVAGPGSGKTRIIVHRIAYLLRVARVRPRKILAVAFNRNAVAELRRRLLTLIGRSAASVRIHTYHSLAMSITGRSLIGARGDEGVFKNILDEAVGYLEESSRQDQDTALDWRNRLLGLEHILVDEYQDINETEYTFLSLLAGRNEAEQGKRPALLAVGDADQNIYAFQGSNVRFIRRFAEEYGAPITYMVDNYRSQPPIVSAANALVSHNRDRMEDVPPVRAVRTGPDGTVRLRLGKSRGEVLKDALLQAADFVEQGVLPGGICILCRTNQDVFALTRMARRSNMVVHPVRRRNLPFPAIREVHDILARLAQQQDGCTGHDLRTQVRAQVEATPARNRLWLDHLLLMADEYGAAYPALKVPAREFCDFVWDVSRDLARFEQARNTAVFVSTMHSAKGLEFPVVIVAGDPSKNADKEEERRLFYVGMTRARDRLVLCGTRQHPFLEEIVREAPGTVLKENIETELCGNDLQDCASRLWEMGADDVVLSYPGYVRDNQTRQAIDRLQTENCPPCAFETRGTQVHIVCNGVSVGRLSARGQQRYAGYAEQGLSAARIIHLASLHRTPSEDDVEKKKIDPSQMPEWHVPLFQVIWEQNTT